MVRIAIIGAIIFGFVVSGWSQAYYEASGQTAVFTLAAGVKSGPAAIKGGFVARATGLNDGISVTTSRGGIVVVLPVIQGGSADIALYNIMGRQIYLQQEYNGTLLRLGTKAFVPGVYSILVHIDGKSYTRLVAVSGWGE
jgi:hypothetical protein